MISADERIRQAVIRELRSTVSPYTQPAWRTTLFLVDGLPVSEALDVVAKLADSGQRGFDAVNKKLLKITLVGEDEQATGT